MSIEEQIKELNDEVRCTLRPSKIHGVGVFALRDIKKGERLFTSSPGYRRYDLSFQNLDRLRPEVKQIILERWPTILQGEPFESPNNTSLMSFMNHSDTPNSKHDIALEDIYKGVEVTEDYRVVPNAEKIYKFL